MNTPVAVVGLVGGTPYGPRAVAAIEEAHVVVGSDRHLAQVDLDDRTTTVELAGPLDPIVDLIADHAAAGRRVCVLSSGDPGFFGIVRLLAARLTPDGLSVHPAPSSVSLAFAAVGSTWDDAVVASAHGRPLAPAVRAVLHAPKAAVLTSPSSPPEALGKALLSAGGSPRDVAVVTRIGEAEEQLTRTDLDGLAAGTFDPMSVVLLFRNDASTDTPASSWGLPETSFEHRGGMITKAEVRAIVLSKLALPLRGVLWDVGAGSGSVAIEGARLSPGMDVIAIEQNPEQVGRIHRNGADHRVAIDVVEGSAPAVLAGLPDPDRVFVGGGGIAVLEACLERLRPGGSIVANYALVDRAAAAYELLGNLVQVGVARGVPVSNVGVRLDAENPVFICWGPADA